MEVILARHAGSCYGVQRALDIANSLLEEGVDASTLGPLIHNPIVVSDLASRGVAPVEDLDHVKGDTVVIRSHGVTPQREDEMALRGLKIVDATCPYVARAQRGAAALAEQGCHVLVVGEAGHPEVESLVAYAERGGAQVDVVSGPSQLPSGLQEPVGVVVQTTQTEETLEAVLSQLRFQGIEPNVKRTICSATHDRQKAAAELAKSVDAMVVIGGKNSSNTTRLAEICSVFCESTFHIESASELSGMDMSRFDSIGVTAGASTPEDQIEVVLDALRSRA